MSNFSQCRPKTKEEAGASWMCLGYHRGRCTKAKKCGINNYNKFHHHLIQKDPDRLPLEQIHANSETNPFPLLFTDQEEAKQS